jgi:uncharacterized membrane protein
MKQRLVFVDLLRGWAAIVMIEVHVFNGFLLPAIKEERWFGLLNYVNGLVAPAFLFISGFVFVLTSERKLEEYRTFGSLFWKQLQRIALVWTIGYGLHLPFFSFTRILRETDERGWLKFYQADVLHCIALGLTILFILRIIVLEARRYQNVLAWISAALLLVAPIVWDIDFNRWITAPFGAYLNGQHVSQFPVFNWLAFLTLGGISAMRFGEARNSGREFDFFKSLTYLGGTLIVGGILIRELPFRFPLASNAIRVNPFFFAERTGIIFVLLALCWWYASARKTERSFVIDASKESLMVYAGHLLVIFGQFSGETSLWSLYGGQLNLGGASIATTLLIAVFIVAAKLWNVFKSKHPEESKMASYTFFTVLVVLFFVRSH